jgi:hypothetical protein
MHPAIRLRSRQPQRNRADSPARLVQVSRPPGMRPIGKPRAALILCGPERRSARLRQKPAPGQL